MNSINFRQLREVMTTRELEDLANASQAVRVTYAEWCAMLGAQGNPEAAIRHADWHRAEKVLRAVLDDADRKYTVFGQEPPPSRMNTVDY